MNDRELSSREAEAVLDDLARLRSATRRAWGAPWFAMVCFGGVTVVAGAALAALGPVGLVMTWVVAGAAALGLVARYHRRHGRRAGVAGRGAPAWRWSLTAFAVCFAAGIGAGGASRSHDGGIVATILVVFAFYVAFAIWLRRADVAIAAASATAAALVTAALAARPWLVELAFGVALIAAGGGLRARTGAP